MSLTVKNFVAIYHPSADHVIPLITEKTTKEEFDHLMEENKEYRLNYQSGLFRHALDKAVSEGNESLICHKGGRDLVNLKSICPDGLDKGHIPLYTAVCQSPIKKRFQIAKTLLEFGADVNEGDLISLRDEIFNCTPLLRVATLKQTAGYSLDLLKITDLLLRYQAKIPSWDDLPYAKRPRPNTREWINKLKQKVDDDQKITDEFQMCCLRLRQENSPKKIPKSIVNLVLYYFREIKIENLIFDTLKNIKI